jgi:hypothetical protein
VGRVRLLRPHPTQTIFLLTTFLSTHLMPLAINVYKNHPVFAGLIIHQRLLKSNCQAMRVCTANQAIRSAGIRRGRRPAHDQPKQYQKTDRAGSSKSHLWSSYRSPWLLQSAGWPGRAPAPIRFKLPARRPQRTCYGLPEGWAH